MSIDLINGVPGHPLFVHASVVLVPLTALALVASALWTGVARRFSWVLPVLGLVTLGFVLVTTESGEWLEARVDETPLVERHTELGSDLTPWAIALFVLTAVVWGLGMVARRRSAGGGTGGGGTGGGTAAAGSGAGARLLSLPVRIAVLVLSRVAAVGAVVQVYRIGDSGAKAAWQGQFSTHERHGEGGGD